MTTRLSATLNMSLDSDMLQAKLDMYENSTQVLRKELPLYFQIYSEKSRSYKSYANAVKNVASCESDMNLQRALFLSAQAYENIESSAALVQEKEEQLFGLMDELKSLALSPFREILTDTSVTKRTIVDETLLSHYDRSLSVNYALFEAYRVKYLRAIISSQIHAELEFHCSAVQELSTALQALKGSSK